METTYCWCKKKKASKNISVLSKAKYVLDYKATRIWYCSLIMAHLSYCIEVWANIYMSNTKPLFLWQKESCTMLISGNTNKLLIKSGLFQFKALAEFRTLLILFRARNKICPANLHRLSVLVSQDEKHRRFV